MRTRKDSLVTIRIQQRDKLSLFSLAEKFGLSASGIVRLLLNQAISEDRKVLLSIETKKENSK